MTAEATEVTADAAEVVRPEEVALLLHGLHHAARDLRIGRIPLGVAAQHAHNIDRTTRVLEVWLQQQGREDLIPAERRQQIEDARILRIRR